MATLTIQKAFFKVADFISWQKAGNLVLSPYFQRRAVWKPGAKSYLIDTIVRGLPIPIVVLRDRRTDPDQFEPIREVVDGQQRLRTVLSYVCPELLKDYNSKRDDFTIKRTHNKELAGKRFKELDENTKSSILDYEFNVHVLPSRVDDREIVQIFRRMNSTNYSLTKQELRNAHYYGEFKTSVYDIATEQLPRWRKWKTFTEDNIARMIEVEYISECFLMVISGGILGKSAPRIDNAFKTYDENFPHREEIEYRFRSVMDIIDDCFSGEIPDFTSFKRTLIYTFFSFIYYLTFGQKPLTSKFAPPTPLTTEDIAKIKLANERIRERTAPEEVLEATDRRTTNPKERNILFEYLKKNVKNGGANE